MSLAFVQEFISEVTVRHVGIANRQWQVKHSQHSRSMHNPQFYVSGKSPVVATVTQGQWLPQCQWKNKSDPGVYG